MNPSKQSLLALAVGMIGLALGACAADPAANAPAAEVSSPAPAATPAPETTAPTTTYAFAPESSVGFVGSKVTGSHEGGFESFTGEVEIAGDNPSTATVRVEIDTTSLWSDDERLTGHLKSEDFFDVATYPTASFTSTSITANDDGTHTITGNLDLHGVNKQISFPATVNMTDSGFTANAEFSIKRFDFDIVYKGKADDLIRDDVLIKLDLRSAVADSEAGAEDTAA